MPTVPIINKPSVEVAPVSTTYQNVPGATPGAFGAGIGGAVADLGGAFQNAGAVVARKKAEDDERSAKSNFLEYGAEVQGVRSNFLSSEGQNSLDIYEQALKDVDALGKSRLEKVSNNRVVAESLKLAIQADRLQLQKQFDSHLSIQKKVVDDNHYDALILDATNDGAEGYKSFGADGQSEFDNSFSGNAHDAVEDKVLVGESSIRRLTEDKAKKDGLLPEAAAEEAVEKYYDEVIRSVMPDDPSAALRIFNASREKIKGPRGTKLKALLKSKTAEDTALFMARKIYADTSHLPQEQRFAAGLKEINKITDSSVFKFANLQFRSLIDSDTQIKAVETPPLVRESVLELLATKSPSQVAKELLKIKDKAVREEALSFLAIHNKITADAGETVAKDFAGQVYREEDDDSGAAEAIIKKQFKDDHKSLGIALAELKKLADTDASLLKTDLPSAADKAKKDIIAKVTNDLPEGASTDKQLAAAILEAEKIKDPEVAKLAAQDIRLFYGSLSGFDKEQAADAGVDLLDKISKTEKTQVGITKGIQGSGANAKTKAAALSNMKSLDTAAKKDEKVLVDSAKKEMGAAMVQGQSPAEFRSTNPEAFDLATREGTFLGSMVSVFKLTEEGKEFPFVSDPATAREVRALTDDELVGADLTVYRGRLKRADAYKLEEQQRGAIARRKTENARVASSVTRNINRLQPYNQKGKPKLTKGVLAKVDNYVWAQIADAQKEGLTPGEEDVKKMVISAFTVVEFSPDDPGFFESIFGLDRGGSNKDVAGAVIAEMSDKELNTLRVDEDNFPTEMDRFLQIAVGAWKRKNTGSGEPSEDDLELLRGNVLKFVLRNQGNK